MATANIDATQYDLVGVHVANQMCSHTDDTESENISSLVSAHVHHVHFVDWLERIHDRLDDHGDW